MTINWIRCSDQMPPDDEKLDVIYRVPDYKPYIASASRSHHLRITNQIVMDLQWIPFTDEAWKELNK